MGYKSALARLIRAEGRLPCGGKDIIINMPDRWGGDGEREKLNGLPVWVGSDRDSVKIYRIGKDEDGREYRDMSAEEVAEYMGGLAQTRP